VLQVAHMKKLAALTSGPRDALVLGCKRAEMSDDSKRCVLQATDLAAVKGCGGDSVLKLLDE
jgi:hypothetical protein